DFTLALDLSAPDRGQSLRIDQALASVPETWSGVGSPIEAVTWDSEADGLVVSFADGVDPASLIAATGPGGPQFGVSEAGPAPDTAFLPSLGGFAGSDIVGSPIEVTFLTEAGAHRVTVPVGPDA